MFLALSTACLGENPGRLFFLFLSGLSQMQGADLGACMGVFLVGKDYDREHVSDSPRVMSGRSSVSCSDEIIPSTVRIVR